MASSVVDVMSVSRSLTGRLAIARNAAFPSSGIIMNTLRNFVVSFAATAAALLAGSRFDVLSILPSVSMMIVFIYLAVKRSKVRLTGRYKASPL
jgi:hypothetical protein